MLIDMTLHRQFLRFFGFFPNPIGRMPNEPEKIEKATFAMGCFWAPDGLFGCTTGVVRTRVGYTGGTKENPTYRNLGDHTETVDIEYDPQQTDYLKLLRLFWKHHDPTERHPKQYMSAVFYNNEQQQRQAEDTLKDEQKTRKKQIVTQILKLETFYDAEDYHQKYRLQQHGDLMDALGLSSKDVKRSIVAARLNGYVGGHGTLDRFQAEWADLGLTKAQADYVRPHIAAGK